MADSPITNGRVVNPGAADFYYQVNGTAYDSKSDFSDGLNPGVQPTLTKGAAQNLYSDRTLINAVGHYIPDDRRPLVMAGNNVGAAAWGDAATAESVAASSGYLVVTDTAHGLVVGDVVNLTDTNSIIHGPQRVTAKTDDTFTTTKTYTSGAGGVTYRKHSGTFAQMTAGAYLIRGYSTTTTGSKTLLRNPGSGDYRRAIHQVEAMRTTRTATAIRAGYWNEYSGSWSTAPTTANDISTWETNGTDDVANPSYSKPGELVITSGKPIPTMSDYRALTS